MESSVPELTPEQRSLRARIAANTRWANEAGKAQGVRGQKGLRAKFRRDVRAKFPDLAADEIERRTDHALKAHMQRIALKSSKARAAVRNAS
jgi:hypothetical protein